MGMTAWKSPLKRSTVLVVSYAEQAKASRLQQPRYGAEQTVIILYDASASWFSGCVSAVRAHVHLDDLTDLRAGLHVCAYGALEDADF